MLVLDASVALEVLLNTPLGIRCAKSVLAPGETLHAPHLLDVEFAQVLRRLQRSSGLSVPDAEAALDGLEQLPLVRYAHTVLLRRVWALRNALSAYDAAYVALAEGLDAPLVTCDAKLGRAHGHHAKIVVLS